MTQEIAPRADKLTIDPDPSRVAWMAMCDLVLDNERRRYVADALGISFGRIRALKRLRRGAMTQGELASVMDIDAPYATVVVDDLESRRLVRRRPHPKDRRAKLVELTRKGRDLVRRAETIMSAPPTSLSALDAEDLETLARILGRLSAPS